MKKLLLVLCGVLFVSLNSFSQIFGIERLRIGDEATYYVSFYNQYGTTSWSLMGTGLTIVSQYGNSVNVKATTPGMVELTARMNNPNGYVSESHSLMIYIEKDPAAPAISGPSILRPNKEYKFKLGGSNLMFIGWDIPKQYFDVVSMTQSEVTLKTKDIEGTTYLRAENSDGSKTIYSYHTVFIQKPISKITPRANLICSNDTLSFSLSDTDIEDDIYWESAKNLTLVSGQGTSKAIFKGSGNGYGKVKATIKYDGKEYIVENSDVWVGPPGSRPFISGPTEMFYGRQGTFSIVSDVPYATDYTWTMYDSPNANFVFGNTGKNVTVEGYRLLPLPPGGLRPKSTQGPAALVALGAAATNKCGCGPYGGYSFTISEQNNNGGGTNPGGGINPGGGSGPGGGTGPGVIEFSAPITPSPLHIKVYSLITGSLVYQEKNVVDFNIQNTGLKEGLYIVEKTDSNGNVTKDKVAKTK